MIGDVEKLYPLWVKEARSKAKGDLTRAQQSLDALQTRGIYYDSIKAMRDARQRVYDVLLATPDTLGAEPVSAPAGDVTDDEIKAGIRAFQSGHNGFDNLSDWRAFANTILASRAAAPAWEVVAWAVPTARACSDGSMEDGPWDLVHASDASPHERKIGQPLVAARAASAPACEHCHGVGEVFGHADDCRDDLCALNGDEHSCAGKMEPCDCAAAAPLTAWPEDLPIRIQVGYSPKDWDTHIYGASGHITMEMLKDIDEQIRGCDADSLFDKGPGDYLLSASYFKGQYGFEGRCEFPPGWELSVEAFRPLDHDTPTPGIAP